MITVLVDLANTEVARVHNPNPPVLAARLDASIAQLSDCIVAGRSGVSEIRFRLYDGWFDETGAPTPLYGMLRAHVRSDYPKRRRTCRAYVEVAESLLAAPADKLLGTAREGAGFGPHHLKVSSHQPAGCQDNIDCGINALVCWAKGRCPGGVNCAVSADMVVAYKHQKLVDTALVADAVWLGSKQEEVVVVSNDEDMVPGLVTARCLGSRVTWVGRHVSPRQLYNTLIIDHKVGHITC